MKYLWSPWRMSYIKNHNNQEGCIFCSELERPDGVDNLIVFRTQRAFVILNRYPYTSGHLMVVPFDHQPSLEQLDAATRADMIELSNQAIQVLQAEYKAQGFNLGINIGDAAGAGVVDHVHIHIVPRWLGDTNFMSSLAHTRVLPEGLEETFWRIHNAWRGMEK